MERTMMDYKLLMNTAILAGETMLKSGAETYRVEDTINRILKTSNAQTVETVVLMTGIFVTLDDSGIDPITVNKRVHARGMKFKPDRSGQYSFTQLLRRGDHFRRSI